MTKRREIVLEDEVDFDTFVPDAEVRREFDVSAMTLHRWDHDPDLGFPVAVVIRCRKYRSRRALQAFKDKQIKLALASRKLIPIREMNSIRKKVGIADPAKANNRRAA